MAEDTREIQRKSPVAAAGWTAAEPPKKIPRGVVLGPDGKPCRSCTSFAAWAAQTKSTLKTPSSTLTATPTAAAAGPPPDCPADVETLGRSTWTLLHTIAATYPKQPTPAQQTDLRGFMGSLSRLYPCWSCAEDFQAYISRIGGIGVSSRAEFGNWLCEAHNEVNRKLGKPVFDCSRWEERWRTGWKDGRCD